MEIIINDEKLDYTIEQEKSLGDVLNSLENWIMDNGGVIDRVLVDEKDIHLDRQSEELHQSITSIKKLSLQTLSRFDHAFTTIQTVGVYIDKVIGEYLKSRNIEDYELIIEGIHLIAEGMKRAAGILHLREMVIIDEKGRSLSDILADLNRMIDLYEKQYIDGEERSELRGILTELQHLLPKVLNWAVLKNSLGEGGGSGLEVFFLKAVLIDLENISTRMLDRFERIGVYVLQFFLTAYSMDSSVLSSSDFSIEELFRKMTDALKEVEESFKSDDLITVGDILEYEIKPLFEAMIDLLHRIGVFIQ